ncbi:Small heat shock protein HSP16.5 [uncultured archaeon]|nr:Small heat shock protein HSP16.5 [uncultured archaeon]
MIPPSKRRGPFDDIFRDMEDEFKRMEEEMNKIIGEASKGNAKIMQGKPIVYGFSMKVGPDGKPRIEEFGNAPVRSLPNADVTAGQREPLVDVIDGAEEITVIAELPGVDKKDIRLEADDDILSIRVDTAGRKYAKEIELPAEVDVENVKANYKNGILEVKLARKEPAKKDRKQLKVE